MNLFIATLSLAAVTVTPAAAATAPAQVTMAASSSASVARVDTSVRAEAIEIADDAAALRHDVSRTMEAYARDFRGDLTRDEQRTLDGYVAQASRRMNDVVLETSRLERAARGRSVSAVEQARARSQTAWARAQMAAEDSFDSARSILEPHMSLIEKIAAMSDYTSLMTRFEDLGERIDTLDVG